MPNERPDSGTTVLEVNLPEDQPIANVSVRPKQGWTYQVETRQLDEPIDNHGEEPEHPAPLLTLVDAEEDHGGSGDGGETTANGEPAADSGGVTVENAASQDDVDSANVLGIIGIVVGTLGLLVGGIALFRRRSA